MADLPYRTIAFVGAPGAGKAQLVRAIGTWAMRRDPRLASAPREVMNGPHPSTVLDVRAGRGVAQLVYFDNPRAEAALIATPPFHGAVLVVSGTDGVQPGTWDSIQQAQERHVRFVLGVVTRAAQIEDPELLDLVKMEASEQLKKHLGPEGDVPMIATDAGAILAEDPRWGESAGAILQALAP